MPRGGRRPGAGRKPKPKSGNDLARVLAHPSSAASAPVVAEPPERFEPPAGLSDEERQVWFRQSPFAFDSRTLTRATALAFERYCQVVVLERNEAKSSGVGGANHRGLLRQINAYELQFMLVPCGKPLPVPVTAVAQTEDDAFFGGARVGSRPS